MEREKNLNGVFREWLVVSQGLKMAVKQNAENSTFIQNSAVLQKGFSGPSCKMMFLCYKIICYLELDYIYSLQLQHSAKSLHNIMLKVETFICM